MKNNIFVKYICVFLILIIAFISTLTLSSMFSSKRIYNNVKESSEVLLKEGNRKIIYIPYRHTKMQFDNYTDALMLNTAYSIDSETPLYSAFVARKNYIPNVTTRVYEDAVGELKSSSKYKYHNEVGELNDLVNGENAESFEYARYWHGYLTFLRPLLLVFNITQLRIILTILLIMLSITLAITLYKKTNIIVSMIFLLSLWSVEYFYLGFSLQGIFVFLIAVISSILLITRFKKIKHMGLLFFITGMLTNFFDFLTVPLVTLAMPLTIYFVLSQRENDNILLKQQIIDIIKYTILWGIGYGLTWFTKWFLVDFIFDRNMIKTSIQQVLYRSVGVKKFNVTDVLYENLDYIKTPFIVSIMIVFICMMSRITLNHANVVEDVKLEKMLVRIIPYLIISCMPFVWYIVLQNHSLYHAFFTYRNLAILVTAVNLCIEELITLYLGKEQ